MDKTLLKVLESNERTLLNKQTALKMAKVHNIITEEEYNEWINKIQ